MIQKILTGAITAATLFVALASSPSDAYGDSTAAQKAYVKCRMSCHETFEKYAESCGKNDCKEKCTEDKSSSEGCKTCVQACMGPHKKEITTCMEKCPPPPK